MLRKSILMLFALAAPALLVPEEAFAGGMGGYRGGGGYAYYPPYDVDGNYVYNAGGLYGDGSCYVIQRRIPTPYGWVLRPIQICN